MKGLFSPESSIAQFLSTLFDLIVLNLLFLICCMPIITIGASATALLRQTLSIVRQEGASVRSFFSAFRRNFKHATIIWCIYLAISFLVYFDVQLLNRYSVPMGTFILALVLALFLISSMVLLYSLSMVTQFKNTLKNYIVCALFLAFSHFPTTVCLLILHAAPVAVFLTSPKIFLEIFPLMVTIGFSTISLISAFLLNRLFKDFLSSTH